MSERRWHRPRAFALLLTLAAAGAFCALGQWQLGRAAQKRQLLDAFANAERAPAQALDPARDAGDENRYPHVRTHGRFDAAHAYLLDERVQDGKLGVHAIAVFEPDGERAALLVDRGWVAWDHAPGTHAVVPPPAREPTELSGIYAPFPGSGLAMGGDALKRQSTWPKLSLRLDPAAIAADLGRPVLPRVLLLDAATGSGFVRAWTPAVLPPERHVGYAVQWFALAAAAVAVFIALHWRKPESRS